VGAPKNTIPIYKLSDYEVSRKLSDLDKAAGLACKIEDACTE
ncbi:hypothetical protein A2U01_0054884, partial [Trifolium medium]|nr:hypothetical protein [Trifolium medium]